MSYRVDPDKAKTGMDSLFSETGFKNADLSLPDTTPRWQLTRAN